MISELFLISTMLIAKDNWTSCRSIISQKLVKCVIKQSFEAFCITFLIDCQSDGGGRLKRSKINEKGGHLGSQLTFKTA